MCLAHNIIAIFMLLLAMQTVYEYFFYWEAFEQKFGVNFKMFPKYMSVVRNFFMFFYALLYKGIKLVAVLVIFRLLLEVYVNGIPFLRFIKMVCVYYFLRLRRFYRNHF